MIKVRKSDERGSMDFGWLKARYTFSFGRYVDRAHMGFRSLRVMNEDRVAGGQGFGTHPHDNMEIITYIVSGELEHKDSMGNGSVIRAGEFQRMSAGSGVTHSEFNPSETETAHLYQVWLLPKEQDVQPSYEQRSFAEIPRNSLISVATPDPDDGAMTINQDASLFLVQLDASGSLEYPVVTGRGIWIQVIEGELQLKVLDGAESTTQRLQSGDGASIEDVEVLRITAESEVRCMLFDLL